MTRDLLKYILVALVVGALLKSNRNLNLDDQKICTLVVLSTALVFAVDTLFRNRRENMESVAAIVNPHPSIGPCDPSSGLCTMDQDEVTNFIRYDFETPSNPLLMHGGFEYDLRGVDNSGDQDLALDKLPGRICESKMDDFVEQHNHARWSPHTHIGKARNYLNWKTFY